MKETSWKRRPFTLCKKSSFYGLDFDISESGLGYEFWGGRGGPLPRLIESLTIWDKRGTVDSRHKLKQYHGLYPKFRGSSRGLDSPSVILRETIWFRRRTELKIISLSVERATTRAETYSGRVKVKLASDKSFILVTLFIWVFHTLQTHFLKHSDQPCFHPC